MSSYEPQASCLSRRPNFQSNVNTESPVGHLQPAAMSSFKQRPKDGGIDAPMSLGGLFVDSSDDEQEGSEGTGFEQQYSEQSVQLGEESMIIRQYCWHMANANKGN